jgi:hypothetical protein
MAVRVEEDHPSLVVVGGFDPRRFHPEWFRAEQLLGKSEAEQAEIKVVYPEITEWSTEAMHLQVTRDRLLVRATVESSADVIRDLVVGTLQLLDQTVVSALGLNRTMHFDVGGEENWHRIGDRLAPKELWRPHFPRRPGMRTLQIEDSPRADHLPGKTIITVQPSQRFPHGVSFDVNNEVVNRDQKPAAFFVQVISDHWPRLFAEARSVAESVLEGALA